MEISEIIIYHVNIELGLSYLWSFSVFYFYRHKSDWSCYLSRACSGTLNKLKQGVPVITRSIFSKILPIYMLYSIYGNIPICSIAHLWGWDMRWFFCSFKVRDHSVNVPSQWEMALHCNAISHSLGAYTEWSLKVWRLMFCLRSLLCVILWYIRLCYLRPGCSNWE